MSQYSHCVRSPSVNPDHSGGRSMVRRIVMPSEPPVRLSNCPTISGKATPKASVTMAR